MIGLQFAAVTVSCRSEKLANLYDISIPIRCSESRRGRRLIPGVMEIGLLQSFLQTLAVIKIENGF
jgi:hypothetical protein